MSTRSRWLNEAILRTAAVVGLATSTLLIAEYREPSAAICAPGGGCELARQSTYASLLGVPLPVFGVLFFAAILCTAVIPQLRRWLLPLAAAGGAAGAALIGIQAFALGAFCRLCVTVDVSALTIVATVLVGHGTAPPSATAPVAAAHLLGAGAVAAGAFCWHASLAAPPAVAPQAGRVTVVEFVDFECPACRKQYGEFSSVLASYADRVNLVVMNMPLRQHLHAMDAARAYCCAAEHNKATEMADRLFKAQKLGRADCEEIAVSLGLDRNEFHACVDSDNVTQRLRADTEAAASAGIEALPTLWIGQERLEGVHGSAALRASIERALRGPTPS